MSEKYTVDYMLPSEILKKHGITRHQWLTLYYTDRDTRKEEFDKVMVDMEEAMSKMEKESITNPYRRDSIFHLLEYWFPDLYSKVKFSVGAKKKEDRTILEDAVNKSGVDLKWLINLLGYMISYITQ